MPAPISADRFLEILPKLGFSQRGGIFTKSIGPSRLTVDTIKQTLHYPEDQGLTINERQTCNFSSQENFVVFECVHRLLEKGYLARHIELEPKWKLGHGASGGRADILIRDNLGKPLLIVECKTAGREFDRAWSATLRDGDQLFSYAHQEPETPFLCLYASFVEDGELQFANYIIALRDNEKHLAANSHMRGFKDATDQKSRFEIWRDTYKQDYTPGGIFEEAIQPYHIGKDKYSLADLKPISFSDQQKQYHRFATILRQHNVSGRENAFDKLVNLFLCKLVDETENPDDLKFYWKGVAYDTHFELLDRLQQLYQRGMGKFLGEDITYINEGDVSNALRFIRQNPDATHRAVWNLFIQQKFFTNNDFSFIDVHNEKLFYQNSEVLLKILQMWQDVRLVDETRHNQFLGDMFEGFLDQGVKQSEGQFFTPMPICRFLLMCLPLEDLVSKIATPIKSIDYACGAGHFLTELALQLKPLAAKHHPLRDIDEYHRAIFGIEKEYRLSKIAKVSAFMYQQPGIQICYCDALIHDPDAYPEIKNGTFDLLVANPPFSVKGFLETLPDSQRAHYQLTETVNDPDTANAIETFFLERAAQLLKPGGVAAIILKASIISNSDGTNIRAREILLQNFDVVAIAEFGSGTFGKTGTNTVTLFLRRKAAHPDSATHYRERIQEWFSALPEDQTNELVYQDAHLITSYASHIGVPLEDYKTLLRGEPSDSLLAHETFAAYVKEFEGSTEITNLRKQKKFKALGAEQQSAEFHKRRIAYLYAIEKDKLLYFILTSEQKHPVIVLKGPTDTKERKSFVGYEWSGAKGDEGIKIIKDAAGRHLTPLYDETNRDNPEKINHSIARNFQGKLDEVPDSLCEWLTVTALPDLLDFTRTGFDKQIGLSAKDSYIPAIASKWPVVKLGAVADYSSDRVDAHTLDADTYVGVDNLLQQLAGKTQSSFVPDTGRITAYRKGDVLLSNIRPYLKKIWMADNDGGASNDVLVLRVTDIEFDSGFIYAWLSQKAFFDYTMAAAKGSKMPRGDKQHILNYLVPQPPINIQRKIVAECEAVDKETELARSKISKARQDIEAAVDEIYASDAPRRTIESLLVPIKGAQTKIQQNEILQDGPVPVVTQEAGRLISGYAPEEIEVITDVPLVVFGDHTCVFKYVDFQFVRGADGTQLLKTNPAVANAKFLRYILENAQITNSEKYERHFKYLKVVPIPVPPTKVQQRFVKTVEELEAEIAVSESVLAAVEERKAQILKKHLQ